MCFLKGSRSLLWCVVFVIWFWLHSGLPSGLWGLDVALGVRGNQYKSVCVILSFPYLTYVCFKLFLLTADNNNRLNHKNNRLIFWKSTKTTLCIAFLSFFLCDSSLVFILPSKFSKNFYKQFTPLLFKVIYSNNVHSASRWRFTILLHRRTRGQISGWETLPLVLPLIH